MSVYREPPKEPASLTTSKPERCKRGAHVRVLDAINACVACAKCGCVLSGSRSENMEAIDLRFRFELEYRGGLFNGLKRRESGDGQLRQDYWYLWDNGGPIDGFRPSSPAAKSIARVAIAVAAVVAAILPLLLARATQ